MDIRSAMKNVPRYRWFLWAAALAAALFFVTQMDLLRGKPGAQVSKGFELLDSLMSHIRRDYLEERDPLQTAEGTYRGLVNSLDPLSAYLSKDLVDRYRALTGRETGPGTVVLKRYAAFPQVVGVTPKSPAEAAGIRLGDLVSAVDGRGTLSMSLTEVKLLLAGTDDKPVRLRLLRGNETLDLDVPRALLAAEPFAFTAAAAGRPAVLAVRRIDPSLLAGLREAVLPALKTGKSPLVLDLRGCQDGDPGEALKLANLFVKAADAGRFEGRDGAKEPLACPDPPALGALPLVVWTDAGTAGPAEIVAGLLQEVRKAKVVGFATSGLAGRTALFPLKDASGVVLTSGVYALPSGRKLWDEGIKPDVPLSVDKLDDKTYFEKSASLLPKL